MSEEKLSFQAEVSRLLNLMVNSVYSDRDVVLRELISNSSDACDKLRYRAISEPELIADDPDYVVEISTDVKKRTLTVSDNGIGMNRDDLIQDLGTIARSGTNAFVEQLSGDSETDVDLIGRFGVGFYSVFMIAKKVEVTSLKASEDQAWCWRSNGLGEFTISESKREKRGTTITLHLKSKEDQWLKADHLRGVIRKYSDHISLPIKLSVPGEELETINAASAIWTRAKQDITEKQYAEFYHNIGHALDEPWLTIHYKAEGKIEYSALIFVPSSRPFDLFDPARKHSIKLYVKRVFITDDVEGLIPPYLRFLRGIVDSEDLPLNMSREMLQATPLIARMRQALTRRVFSELKKKAKNKPEEYSKFWENFGPVLKEGLYEDEERRDDLLGLVRFKSNLRDGFTDLTTYIDGMKENQLAIYYIVGEDLEVLKNSPQLEGYNARGVEVLLLSDPVDDFWLSVVTEFNGRPLHSATRGASDLSNIDVIKGDAREDQEPIRDAEIATLIALLKQNLGEAVKDVRTTDRLTDSPVCLIADDGDLDLRLERMLKAHNKLENTSTRIMEINPQHRLIRQLVVKAGKPGSSEDLSDIAMLLFDQARIIEGESIVDPGAFARRMADVMVRAIGEPAD